MSFPSHSLVPCGGKMYSIIFENTATGVVRSHFLSATIQFEPIKYADEDWNCSITTEWIPLRFGKWQDCLVQEYTTVSGSSQIESSFYMCQHHPASLKSLSISHIANSRFRVEISGLVDFTGYLGGDEDSAMRVHAEAEMDYFGLVIVPGNFFPKPLDSESIRGVAQEFVDLSVYQEPKEDRHRFVLLPR